MEFILLKDDFSRPIHNNLKTFYKKSINKKKDTVHVNLSFNYLEKDFMNSNYINTCFEKKTINQKEDYFEIHLSGEFYCLQDKTLTIQVTSNYQEETTNGEQAGNTFQWIINETNKNNVNIYYKVKRNKTNMLTSYEKIPLLEKEKVNYVLIEFIIIVILIIGGTLYYYLVIANNKRKIKTLTKEKLYRQDCPE